MLWDVIDVKVYVKELYNAVLSLKSNKDGGMDEVSADHLRFSSSLCLLCVSLEF